jgi:hypothetical protein
VVAGKKHKQQSGNEVYQFDDKFSLFAYQVVEYGNKSCNGKQYHIKKQNNRNRCSFFHNNFPFPIAPYLQTFTHFKQPMQFSGFRITACL